MSEMIYQFAFSFIRQEAKAAARLLEEVSPTDIVQFLSTAPQLLATAVLKEMLPSICANVLINAELSTAIIWLRELANNHICAILRNMEKSKQDEFLSQFSFNRRTACNLLLNYNNDMLGAWVETDVPIYTSDMTAEDAIKRLKLKSFKDDRMIFVVDDNRRPIGTLSISKLLRSQKTTLIEGILNPTFGQINAGLNLATALGHSVWMLHDIVAVVNRRSELIGIIAHSQIRHLLSTRMLLQDPTTDLARGTALDIIHAYGESMHELLETAKKTIG